MSQFNNVLETLNMIEKEKLDIRTITMGISLLDCCDTDGAKARDKIYQKITTLAKDLVRVGEETEEMYGIPIINKRISVTPISLIAQSSGDTDYFEFAKTLDAAAKQVGVNFIGGFSALVQKGYTKGDKILIDSIPMAMAATERVCSSVNVAFSKAGINMDAVRDIGKIIKQTAYLTRDQESIGCAKIVIFANVAEDNPFMAGAFHGVSEAECVIHIGISGPGVVKVALEKVKGQPFDFVCETIKKQPSKSLG